MTVATTILIVEDDAAIRDMLCFSLKHAGFACEAVSDGEQGLEWLAKHKPDIILLDWMLPGIDGIEFIRRLRSNEFIADIPVIMLTAKGGSDDMVKGLGVGADDYINKPFSPPELVARIKALLRRTRAGDQSENQKLEFGDLTLDTQSHRVTVDGQRIDLGPTEFRLLHFFMKTPERAYSRGQLLDQVWGDTVYIEERTVDVHIRRLRKALEPSGQQDLVQTVRGVGYRFSMD
jgi:two-component system phosphate regulon response regulator PhoB